MATLIGELPKSNFIRLNRRMLTDRLKEMYGKEVSDKYIDLLNNHFIYKNDETSLSNYCASITMYPWLIGGTIAIGGNSKAPTNLKSFTGGFINMVFIVSSMLSGACATPEFLMYMNYFIQKEFGTDYWKNPDKQVDLSLKARTLDKVITDYFEQVVYSINQPTGARNFQAVFWNISYYDRFYFESLFENFIFPDGSAPDWDSLSWLQKRFMKWFNAERLRTVLTFPVETMALLTENGQPKDKEYGEFTAQMYSEGHSFFTYLSDNADSLSSCCRLRNEITDNEFSYTLGAGGISTGSKSVLTINLNRCIQFAARQGKAWQFFLEEVTDLVHKVQNAYNENLKDMQAKGMLPLFDAGYINMSRQYLTIGVNGLVEAAEFLGIEISDNDRYAEFTQEVLGMVEKYNKKYRTPEVMFNCEMIPAENVGVKHAKWDREAGYKVNRDCYNSYFYIVEDEEVNIVDKFRMHGRKYIEHLTGGSALHMNLDEHLSKEQYETLLRVAAREGCNYFTFNIPNTVCNDCGHIDKRHLAKCPKCGGEHLDYLTRIIGYMKRVSNFSAARQKEAARRHYAPPAQL
jgi:ribonucleoside-triphosphate reductase